MGENIIPIYGRRCRCRRCRCRRRRFSFYFIICNRLCKRIQSIYTVERDIEKNKTALHTTTTK